MVDEEKTVYIEEEGRFSKAIKKPFRNFKDTFTPKEYCDNQQAKKIIKKKNLAYVIIIATIVMTPTLFYMLYTTTEPTVIVKHKGIDFFLTHHPLQPLAIGEYNNSIVYVNESTITLAKTVDLMLILVKEDVFNLITVNSTELMSYMFWNAMVLNEADAVPPLDFSQFGWYDKIGNKTSQLVFGDIDIGSGADAIFKVSEKGFYGLPLFTVKYDYISRSYAVFGYAVNILTEPESFKVELGTNTFDLTDVSYNFDVDEQWVSMDFVTNNSIPFPTSTAIEGIFTVTHELFGYLTIPPEEYNR